MASPVWAGNASAPMRAFIKKYQDSLPETAVFLTHDSQDMIQAFTDIDELLNKEPMACGDASKQAIQADEPSEAIQEFLEKFRA